YVLLARSEYRFDARTDAVVAPTHESWFWGTLTRYWQGVSPPPGGAAVVNPPHTAPPPFLLEAFHPRLAHNPAVSHRVLASGVFIVFAFDFILRTARSYFVDTAGKNADVVLASKIFAHVIGMRFDARPGSVGALAANLREFESLRELVTSSTLMAIADL